jgi:pimeloyl-ACP methyl ester carboxylesterase
VKGVGYYTTRTACGAIVLGCAVLAAGFAYEKICEVREAQRFPAPGKMIDVGGRKIHLLCKGEGIPTVVIETGAATPSFLWWPVQNDLAKLTRVCTYDRPGFGWSEPSLRPLSMTDHAAELQTLLTNAEISGPYLLIGHSYGGALVRLFARAHPDEVSGIVLVESAEEGFLFSPEIQQALKEQERTTRRFQLEARFGIIRFQLRGDPVDAAAFSRPEYYGEWLAEEDSMVTAPAEMRIPGGFGRLGSLPLVVIRRGIKLPESELTGHRMSAAQVEQRQKEAQERLAGLSTHSVLLVADKSGHNVNVEQPGIIVDTVKGVLAAVRQHIPLSRTFRTQ